MEMPASLPHPTHWLVRISEVFAEEEKGILDGLSAGGRKKLGRGFHWIRVEDPAAIRGSGFSKFLRWNLPVHHSWPCHPPDVEGFVEKAAQALARKFGGAGVQTLIVGPLDPGAPQRYYKSLASNLRGRALQLFPEITRAVRDAEDQDPDRPTLFCLVGAEGLYCGVQTPRESNGFFPGGTKFIKQSGPDAISRAGAKVAEAIHYLALYRQAPPAAAHWLELGASPGGMTAELLQRGYRVTAVDRAPLDKRLHRQPGLVEILGDAGTFQPPVGTKYEMILCDMNGDACGAFSQVLRLTEYLVEGGMVIFTLKMPGVGNIAEADELEAEVLRMAKASGIAPIAATHLTYNRYEFTLFFEKIGSGLKKV
jgi:hypothetical protein